MKIRSRKRSWLDTLTVLRSPAELLREIAAQRVLTVYQTRTLAECEADELVVGPYLLERELSRGSCGNCFVASHISSGAVVSLRVLPNTFSKKFQSSIKRSVKLAKQIDSALFQRPLAAGFHRDRGYVASQFVAGEDLYHLVRRRGPLTVHQAVACMVRAVEALAAAHRSGLSHRELRPTKLMVNRGGEISIRDLAMAQALHRRKLDIGNPLALIQVMPRLHLDYIAPEFWAREAVDNSLENSVASMRMDLYSLGCILYFLLTGEPIYPADDSRGAVLAHREAAIPRLSKRVSGLSSRADQCLARMVAKRPQDRFENYAQCHAALQGLIAAIPETNLGKGLAWNFVAEIPALEIAVKPAVRRISLPRLLAGSAVATAMAGGVVFCGLYAWKTAGGNSGPQMREPSQQVAQEPAYTPEPEADKPKRLEPKLANPQDRQNVLTLESEDSFMIR